MATVVNCPQCRRALQLSDDLADRTVRCVHCGGVFTSPVPETEQYAPIREALSPEPLPSPCRELPEAAGTVSCPACGARVAADADRCPHCGEDLRGYDDRAVERPWERPVERRYKPHRGQTVLTLGVISLVCGVVSPCLGGVIAAIVGLALGIPAWVMGTRDLARMKAGEIDPEGEAITRRGRRFAISGVVVNLVIMVLLVAFIVVYVMIVIPMITAPPPSGPPPVRRIEGAAMPHIGCPGAICRARRVNEDDHVPRLRVGLWGVK
jgi:hypothetical protein